jgi:hypothetical protein
LTDGNGKTGSTVATVGENPSAKGRLPEVKHCVGNKLPKKFVSGYCISNFFIDNDTNRTGDWFLSEHTNETRFLKHEEKFKKKRNQFV